MIDSLLRAQRAGPHEVRLDIAWLFALSLILIATGIGLRDPWPADEPRFALIARDMVASGEWLIPRIGGDLYADKPPLFFWIVGAFYWLTGSLRIALLTPSFLAGLGTVILVYDLARRLWDRQVGLAAGLALLATVQFVWQARQGQIDATLCFFTTLGLYGLMRHLLLGPAWRWWCIGWVAAGLGVITKGVGFLPILLLIPYAVARARGWIAATPTRGDWRWWCGPIVMLAAASLWLAPMLFAAAHDPHVALYRDEILFRQTIDRYADAWHHHEPFWYFLIEVIPALWLPLVALLPWLQRCWREAFRARDLRIVLPLVWMLLVLLFFSFSSGKRGVYILPAVPAFVLACAPYLSGLAQRRGPRRTLFAIACGVVLVVGLAAALALFDAQRRESLIGSYGVDVVGPLLGIAALGLVVCTVARPERGFAAYGGVLTSVLLVVSFWVNPVMNDARSGAAFVARVEQAASDASALGLVGYKEQYLLQLSSPAVNFGHKRWLEFEFELADAAAWLAQDPRRMLLVDDRARRLCFADAASRALGSANRAEWFLVSGAPDPECVAKGDLRAARWYSPPRRPAQDFLQGKKK